MRDFPAMFGSQRVNALKSVKIMKVPPEIRHRPKDEDLNKANARKRHWISGWDGTWGCEPAVESAGLAEKHE